jgi:hypothetical protein
MAASVLIYSIGYLSLRQPQIFQPAIKNPEEEPAPAAEVKTTKGTSYQKSGLADKEVENHLKNLINMMETDKPYLNSELTWETWPKHYLFRLTIYRKY